MSRGFLLSSRSALPFRYCAYFIGIDAFSSIGMKKSGIAAGFFAYMG
jgi:hypothetical protein